MRSLMQIEKEIEYVKHAGTCPRSAWDCAERLRELEKEREEAKREFQCAILGAVEWTKNAQ